MPLRFLLDEHIRRTVWITIIRHNLIGSDILDVARVGASDAPPYGTQDLELLAWAERHGRILISEDKSTMPEHLADFLAAGHHSPGIMILRRQVYISELIEFLSIATFASEPGEWENRISYVP